MCENREEDFCALKKKCRGYSGHDSKQQVIRAEINVCNAFLVNYLSDAVERVPGILKCTLFFSGR